MKCLALLSALAALTASAWATESTWSNGTHYFDPDHNGPIRHFGCDVHHGKASHHFNETIKRLHDQHRHSNHGTRAAVPAVKKLKFNVPTYFHVISSTAAASANTITQAMVTAQIQEMNKAYNPYAISFTLKNTTWTTNDAWAIAAGGDMDAAKAALRQGTYGTLNLYFHTDLSGGMLGTCTLPSQLYPGALPAVYVSDGCNVNANTMPGGTMMGYNMGKTAVHETGHWLGLLHTFEGYSCSGSGDYIADTRIESQSTNGCPTSPAKNTCPQVAGVDPIHNYMDYSTDACYTKFSNGQIARIDSLWTQYRQGR